MLHRRTVLHRLAALAVLGSFGAAAATDVPLRYLLGAWTGTATDAQGATTTVEFEFLMNGRFSGRAQIGTRWDWQFSGDWRVRDRLLIWVYTGSSKELAPDAREDIDEIVSVDAERLVLRSRRSGEVRSFTRLGR